MKVAVAEARANGLDEIHSKDLQLALKKVADEQAQVHALEKELEESTVNRSKLEKSHKQVRVFLKPVHVSGAGPG